MSFSRFADLDSASRRVVRRMLMYVAITVIFVVLLEPGLRTPVVAVLISAAAARAALIAFLFSESFHSPGLNHWDETAALLGIKHLVLATL